MKNNKETDKQTHWTSYWEKGILNSCGYDTEFGNYQGSILQFWNGKIQSLDSLSLLDLCTGNGGLISLLLDNKDITDAEKIVGVDIAGINPKWIESFPSTIREKVEFIPNINIANLPIKDNTFDIITSQFGLEYSDLSESLKEASRVLKPGGKIYSVVHNSDSIIVKNSHEEITHINWLLSNKGIRDSSGKLLKFMAMLKNPHNVKKVSNNETANIIRAEFNSQVEEAKVIASKSKCPDIIFECLDCIMLSFNTAKSSGIKEGKEILENLWEELRHNRKRLENLLLAAKTESELNELIKICNDSKLEKEELITLQEKGQVLAWGLTLKKHK
ncbi:class I SAM-dependent methyltransferase [Kangiella aquimarina]|uniref:Class I SAM-dependent methyltransferase n=1 Tax=Kangiella aquimarina TaxID=261965 RepID=A0ABZ0X6H5_9GAMM|nr:class I SAM-dependent methyltransferase [Kangiella aquimarina]WQG85964.1 class I SAM-dependent methyltransferase [Kangiella aquimarina]